MLKHIYLQYKCLPKLASKPELAKAFCIWGRLKLWTKHSAIHNIKTKKAILAKKLGIAEGTFRKYLKLLEKEGFVWIDEQGILRFSNKYTLYYVLGIDPNVSEETGIIRDHSIKLSMGELHIDNIKLLAAQYQKATINYTNEKRIKKELLKSKGTIQSASLRRKMNKSVAKEASDLMVKGKNNPALGYSNDFKGGFVDDNVSCQTLAKVFGRKSKMTGNRFMHKMKRLGVISYSRRHIELGEMSKITKFVNLAMIQEQNTLPITVYKKKGIYYVGLRIPNEWKMKTFTIDSSLSSVSNPSFSQALIYSNHF